MSFSRPDESVADGISCDEKRIYICNHINELKIAHRREVMQTIICAIGSDKIVEKGNGSQIKFKDIGEDLLNKIYNYIHAKIRNPME